MNQNKLNKKQEEPLIKRMFTLNSDWEDKDEFLDIIYWSRQIVAGIIGIVWGFLGLQGIFGIASFIALNSFVVYVYSIKINNNHEDTFEFVKEGFMTAFAVFMVSWIITYSAVYY